MSLDLDPKIVLLMREVFSGHACTSCGNAAERLFYGLHWCKTCWSKRYEPEPPVECRTSGAKVENCGRVRRVR